MVNIALALQNPLPLGELVSIAAEDLEDANDEKNDEIQRAATTVISAKRLMLSDYFSMEVDEDNNLCAIPCLLGEINFFLYSLH